MTKTKDLYKSKSTKLDFLDWLKTYEMPDAEFDYVKTYKMIGDDFFKLFEPDPNHFENTFLRVIDKNMTMIDDALIKWWNTLSDEAKAFYKAEGYGKDDKFGAMAFGEYSHSISSPDFIKNFKNPETQRSVLGMFIGASYKWLAYKMHIEKNLRFGVNTT